MMCNGSRGAPRLLRWAGVDIKRKTNLPSLYRVSLWYNKFVNVNSFTNVNAEVIAMHDRRGRPWVRAVLAGYVLLLLALFVFAKAPWNWVLGIIVAAKGLGFFALMRRLERLGARAPAPGQREPAPTDPALGREIHPERRINSIP